MVHEALASDTKMIPRFNIETVLEVNTEICLYNLNDVLQPCICGNYDSNKTSCFRNLLHRMDQQQVSNYLMDNLPQGNLAL